MTDHLTFKFLGGKGSAYVITFDANLHGMMRMDTFNFTEKVVTHCDCFYFCFTNLLSHGTSIKSRRLKISTALIRGRRSNE